MTALFARLGQLATAMAAWTRSLAAIASRLMRVVLPCAAKTGAVSVVSPYLSSHVFSAVTVDVSSGVMRSLRPLPWQSRWVGLPQYR